MRKPDSGPYELDLIAEYCKEFGLEFDFTDDDYIAINLAPQIVVTFVNNVRTTRLGKPDLLDDSLIKFSGSAGSHCHHHNFEFVDQRGYFTSKHYLEILAGLSSGEILVGSLWKEEELVRCWFIHQEYNNEFEYLDEGEEIKVVRAVINKKNDPVYA